MMSVHVQVVMICFCIYFLRKANIVEMFQIKLSAPRDELLAAFVVIKYLKTTGNNKRLFFDHRQNVHGKWHYKITGSDIKPNTNKINKIKMN